MLKPNRLADIDRDAHEINVLALTGMVDVSLANILPAIGRYFHFWECGRKNGKQVLDEAERNIRVKLPRILPFFAEMLSYLDLNILDDPKRDAFERWLPVIKEKDAPILEAAVSASVSYFLTLNTKHFTADVAAASGLTIQTPGEFVQQIRHILSQNL